MTLPSSDTSSNSKSIPFSTRARRAQTAGRRSSSKPALAAGFAPCLARVSSTVRGWSIATAHGARPHHADPCRFCSPSPLPRNSCIWNRSGPPWCPMACVSRPSRIFCLSIFPWTSKPCVMIRSRWPSVWKPNWERNNRAFSTVSPAIGPSCHPLTAPSQWGLTGATCAIGWTRNTTSRSLWGKSTLSCGEDEDTKSPSHKRLGFVQTLDTKPKRRLYEVLQSQGVQMNQEITFLSDGNDTLRALQLEMSPKATHLLDWFHLTMRLTVLDQYGKGLVQCEAGLG